MHVVFLLGNPDIQQPGYATTYLTAEVVRRGGSASWVGADGLQLTQDGRVLGLARTVRPEGSLAAIDAGLAEADRTQLLAELLGAEPRWEDLGAADVVWLRLLARPRGLDEDDGRYDTYYRARIEAVLAFAARLTRHSDARVVNDPVGLWRMHGKLFAAEVPPAYTPRTMIVRDLDALHGFLRDLGGPAVLKPMLGHGGEDTFRVEAGDRNLHQIVNTLGRQGYIVAQEYIGPKNPADPADPPPSETRIMLLDGEPIRSDAGAIAMYRRTARLGEWRTNMHQGAAASRGDATLSDAEAEVVAAIGPILRRDGLRFAAADLLAGKLLEVNAFCPGGLHLSQLHSGVRATEAVVDRIAWADN